MKAQEFFENVSRPNLKLAIESDGDYRLVVNAIFSVDAVYGILFEHLKDIGHSILADVTCSRGYLRDDDFKDFIAGQSKDFMIVRDAAFSMKHGRLSDRKARVIRSPEMVKSRKLVCGLLSAGDQLGSSGVYFVVNTDEPIRSRLALRRVEIFTEKLLADFIDR